MAALSPASAAAIARLRSYVPPPTTWHYLPASRRAAVLILLYPDKKGDLRVILTMRASTLKSYAGQAALPGGKADSLHESPLHVARREASEEIGLPEPVYAEAAHQGPIIPPLDQALFSSEAFPHIDAGLPTPPDDTKLSPPTPNLPHPFAIEHLCQLPTNLAKTELGVRPCVVLLYATSPVDSKGQPVDVETALIPRLDAKEVAAVFSGPFHNFLRKHDETPLESIPSPIATAARIRQREGGLAGWKAGRGAKKDAQDDATEWYEGSWSDWHESRWRMHNFYVPLAGQTVARAKAAERAPAVEGKMPSYPRQPVGASPLPYAAQPSPGDDPLAGLERFRVFGMTARILVDAARVAYAEDPEFEHNSHFGDEGIISKLIRVGKMGHERQRGDEFVGGDVKRLLRQDRRRGRL